MPLYNPPTTSSAGPISYVMTSGVTVNLSSTTIFTISSLAVGKYNVCLAIYHVAGSTATTHTWGLGYSGSTNAAPYMTYFSSQNAFSGSANVRNSRAQLNTINLTTAAISAFGHNETQLMGGFEVTTSGDLTLKVTSDTSDSSIGPGTAITLFKV